MDSRISTVWETGYKNSKKHSSRFNVSQNSEITELPALKDAPQIEREGILIQKLRQCCVVFDFTHELTHDLKYKEIKRLALLEMIDYLGEYPDYLTDKIYPEMAILFESNCFRDLPPNSHDDGVEFGLDDDDPFMEPSWSHLQLVYQIFIRFLESRSLDLRMTKVYINRSFLFNLLELFDSEDPRERVFVKDTLHHAYAKLIDESELHNGVAEFLEIILLIIKCFAVPIREVHKVFLRRALLPLHKLRNLPTFQKQLTCCLIEFVKKDCRLLKVVVVDGLLKFWPKVYSIKEVMFLNELEECLDSADPIEFQTIIRPLFTQLARCVSSSHFQVAERALFFWSNEYLLTLMTENIKDILPIMFPALYRTTGHWNKSVNDLICNALKIFADVDQKFFDEISAKYQEGRDKEIADNKRREDIWCKIEKSALKNPLYAKVVLTLPNSAILPVQTINGPIDQSLVILVDTRSTS